MADFAELKDALGNDQLTVLDVRQCHEYDESHLSGALNIPLHELLGRINERCMPGRITAYNASPASATSNSLAASFKTSWD